MQMVLPVCLGISNALLQNILGLLDKLAVQIDGVLSNPPARIVLSEYIFGGLLVVLLHLAAVCLSLLRELFGAGAIAVLVGLLRLKQSEVSPVARTPRTPASATVWGISDSYLVEA